MSLVLDTGGLSALAARRGRLIEARHRDQWPPTIPSVVLAEALTGDHRRDFAVNRLLRLCSVVDTTATVCRSAARLRTATGRAGSISAVDAIVVAVATQLPSPVVLTSDPHDIEALSAQTAARIRVEPV